MRQREETYLPEWQSFISGDDHALSTVYDAVVQKLHTFGCQIIADDSLVKDTIQDLFVDLLRYRSNLNPQVNVLSYLFSSFRRKLMQAIKQRQGREEIREQLGDEGFAFEWDAESTFIRNEEERLLYTKLQQELAILSAHQREALYLRFRAGLSYEESATVLGISVASCRTLIYRTVKQLRSKLDHSKTTASSFLWLLIGQPAPPSSHPGEKK
ncbi:RNA polymerase sigma factor [Parapedobacter koreensis]|uniref:RNA polymerase sigma factor, sigma-70 family n=1 Tax=Parapedobacter koreensis TaxID=332977 RepID=A0A1H7Q2M0_9SPHI|nr:sigma-70 family RNA polymerase sigma factor [Parapedobacter koreensis]SEL42086.1 RNA polymerase sigma factor, sigma-70 family [Parapedobacter koreensis]